MNKKTILITGGTDGIGKAAAIGLAKTGATIIIVGRNEQKAKMTVEEIRRDSGNNNVSAITADLSVIKNIDHVVGQIISDHASLDGLVNNIGFLSSDRETTPDGFEKVLFINHLLPMYLTNKLLPLLKKSESARIVNVGGGVYAMGKMNLLDLQFLKNPFKPLKVISNAKLAMVISSLELASKLARTNVSVFVADPGVAKSGMGQSNKGWPWWFRAMMPMMATSTEKAAESTIYAASSEQLKGKSGLIIDKSCKPAAPKPLALDQATAGKLWRASEELLNLN